MSVPFLTVCAVIVALAFGVLAELLERLDARARRARRAGPRQP